MSLLKLTYCLRKRPDLSHEEFYRYWFETHGPLVRERAEILGIVKYQQVHTEHNQHRDDAYRARNGGSWETFDGIAEVWVDPSKRPADATPEAIARAGQDLLDDERRFIDLPNSPMWLGRERVFVDRDASR